jgi:hypothetical protein
MYQSQLVRLKNGVWIIFSFGYDNHITKAQSDQNKRHMLYNAIKLRYFKCVGIKTLTYVSYMFAKNVVFISVCYCRNVFDLRGNTFWKGFIVILSNERIPFVAVDLLKSTKFRIRFLPKK